MGLRLLAAVAAGAVAVLAPLAHGEVLRGDDWAGQVAFAAGDLVYLYEFEGVGCGLPMWCWFFTERFQVATPEGMAEVPGSASWTTGAWGPYGAYHQLHGALDFDGASFDLTWHAVLHSICLGIYEGPVRPALALDEAGRAGATRTGPGPDGQYECMGS